MYTNRMLTIASGKGIYLFDDQGNKYLDMMSNYGVSIFGYQHPLIQKYITNQFHTLINLHGSFHNKVRAEAAQALMKTCDNALSQVHFVNSGTEAIEAAIKFAILATGKTKFIACKHSFHGKTIGALSVTFSEKYRLPFKQVLLNVVFIDHNNTEQLEEAIDKETAAFIVEPIQGESGIYVPKKDYLKKVRKICSQKGILLIIDEIQTGVGRTGKFLTSHWENINPDILCLGKGLAGGIPIGATLVAKEVAQKIPKHIHTSTFGGNPLACAGMLATLQLLTDKRLDHIGKIGRYFIKQLASISSSLIREVRGKGLMIAVELTTPDKRNETLKTLQKEKILAIPAGESAIRFLPPYIVKKEHIDRVVKTLQKILE